LPTYVQTDDGQIFYLSTGFIAAWSVYTADEMSFDKAGYGSMLPSSRNMTQSDNYVIYVMSYFFE